MKKKQAALVAIIGGIVIFGIKLLAYLLSNSVALLSDALESIVNIAASGLMLFSVYMAEKPADAEHNYGYQKTDYRLHEQGYIAHHWSMEYHPSRDIGSRHEVGIG